MDMSVYKPFKEISEESKLKIKSFIENYELEGETFYDIDDCMTTSVVMEMCQKII